MHFWLDATPEHAFSSRAYSMNSGRNSATGKFGKTLRIFIEEGWMWKLIDSGTDGSEMTASHFVGVWSSKSRRNCATCIFGRIGS